MSSPQPPMGISSVGSFPVQSGGSLIFFPTFLRGRHVFILGGCLDAPTFIHPHTFVFPHTFICPQGCSHTPICPPYSSASVCSQYLLHVVEVVRDPLTCWTLPLNLPQYDGASPSVTSCTHSLVSLCTDMFQEYLSYADFSLMLGVWGCSPSVGGSRGHQDMGRPYAHSCTFL